MMSLISRLNSVPYEFVIINAMGYLSCLFYILKNNFPKLLCNYATYYTIIAVNAINML